MYVPVYTKHFPASLCGKVIEIDGHNDRYFSISWTTDIATRCRYVGLA